MNSFYLPNQSYVRHGNHKHFNGSCSECFGPIYGDAFICARGEFCVDCAVWKEYMCNGCSNDTDVCTCAEVTRFYVPVNIQEAA
jgi:hypothetical protein